MRAGDEVDAGQHHDAQRCRHRIGAQAAHEAEAVGAVEVDIDQRGVVRQAARRGCVRGAQRRFDIGRRVDRAAACGDDLAQRLAQRRVVVDDEHAPPAQVGCGTRRRGRCAGARAARREPERRAGTRAAVDADLAAHQRDQAPGDREAEAAAAEAARRRTVGLGEGVEDASAVGLGQADAGVAHLEAQHGGVVAIARQQARREDDFAARRELDRVADEVEQHLAQPPGVAAQRRRQRGGDTHDELEALALRRAGHQRAGLLDALDEVEVHALEHQLALLDARVVEHVVDDGAQRAPRAADHLREALLARRQIGGEQQLRHAQHAVERRSDLVAHRGEELRLGRVGRVGVLLGGAQLFDGMRQVGIAHLDLAEHGVEAVDQGAGLVVRRARGAQRVVAAARDVAHRLAQAHQRRRHVALQPRGEQPGDEQRAAEDEHGEGEQAADLGAQRLVVDDEGDHAEAPSAEVDAVLELEPTRVEDMVRLRVHRKGGFGAGAATRSRRVDAAQQRDMARCRAAHRSQQAAVGEADLGRGDIFLLRQRSDDLRRRCAVAERHRCRRVDRRDARQRRRRRHHLDACRRDAVGDEQQRRSQQREAGRCDRHGDDARPDRQSQASAHDDPSPGGNAGAARRPARGLMAAPRAPAAAAWS